MATKTGYPEVGDVFFHDIGRDKQDIFKKLVKQYEKEYSKSHVYYIRNEFRHSVHKNIRYMYKKTVEGFYPETRHPIYNNQYIDFMQGRFKTFDAEQKAWCDLNPILINKDALPPTDKERVIILEREMAKLKAELAKKVRVSKKAGKTT